MIHLAVFISGGGSNARSICSYFDGHSAIKVALILSNKLESGARIISDEYGIPSFIFNREQYKDGSTLPNILDKYEVDYIILAGFLWLIPAYLLSAFPEKILNIHPALLPKYGGKGMHGMHVHQAVWENKEKESGITIHLCNEKYDEGAIILQEKTALHSDDTAETIAKKVLKLEHTYYAPAIEKYVTESK